MRQRHIAALLGLLFAISPVIASAQSTGNLQQQIQALLQQISVLQERLKALQAAAGSASDQVCSPMMKLACSQAGVGRVGIGCDPRCVPGAVTETFSSTNNDTELVVGSGYVGGQCPRIARSLQRGIQGSDVRDLQEFLRSQGILSTNATGFFGQQTEDAIKNLQQQYGVSGGSGILGPKTAALIARLCGGIGGGSVGGNLTATPGFGKAPLAVSFMASTGLGTSTVSIDYGDGATDVMSQGSCAGIAAVVGGQGGIRCSYSAAHSYLNPGTYTAKASRTGGTWCPPQGMGMPCIVMGTSTVPVGTTVVTVISSTTPAATLSITAPASGLAVPNGSVVTVAWQSTGAPQGATVSLVLVGASSTAEQIIARGQPTIGSYQWYLAGNAIPMMVPGSPSGSPAGVINSFVGAVIGCPIGMDGGPSLFRCGGRNGGYIQPGSYSLVARMYINDSLITFSPGVAVTITAPVPDAGSESGTSTTTGGVMFPGGAICPAIAMVCPDGKHDEVDARCRHSCVLNSLGNYGYPL